MGGMRPARMGDSRCIVASHTPCHDQGAQLLSSHEAGVRRLLMPTRTADCRRACRSMGSQSSHAHAHSCEPQQYGNICKATAHRLRPIAALHTGCCERAFTRSIRGTTLPRPGARDLRSSPIHCVPAKEHVTVPSEKLFNWELHNS